MISTTAPTGTAARTRRIERALAAQDIAPWVGGRTRRDLGVTEHGAQLRDGQDIADVHAAVACLGWAGVEVVDGGAQYNPAAMTDVRVAWIRVPL